MNDLLRYNRHGMANACRRLADEAIRASVAMTDDTGTQWDDEQAYRALLGRVESLKHAHTILAATRTGTARAQRRAACETPAVRHDQHRETA